MKTMRRQIVFDPNCKWCHGDGSYWEQGPNAWTHCTQCSRWVDKWVEVEDEEAGQ